MTDIVERLLKDPTQLTLLEAAEEIERLRAALDDIGDLVEEYADVDDGQPNLAMQVHTVVLHIAARRGHD